MMRPPSPWPSDVPSASTGNAKIATTASNRREDFIEPQTSVRLASRQDRILPAERGTGPKMAAERIKFTMSEPIYIKNSEISPNQHRKNLNNKSETTLQQFCQNNLWD